MRTRLIACEHASTIILDGETVCRKCGVILGDNREQVPAGEREAAGAKSTTNIYERHVTGSRDIIPDTGQMKSLRCYSHKNIYDNDSRKKLRNISRFSNACDLLGIDDTAAEYALRLFHTALKQRGGDRRTADVAAWSIYKSCKNHGIPIDGNVIADNVRRQFGRMRIGDIMSIAYDMMDIPVRDNPDGIMKYHFRLILKKLTKKLPRMDDRQYSRRQADAWNMYNTLFLSGSYDKRAKNAVCKAFGIRRST